MHAPLHCGSCACVCTWVHVCVWSPRAVPMGCLVKFPGPCVMLVLGQHIAGSIVGAGSHIVSAGSHKHHSVASERRVAHSGYDITHRCTNGVCGPCSWIGGLDLDGCTSDCTE